MEDEARTWALPYLELLAQGLLAFQGDYNQFVQAFLKRFAPLDTTEAACHDPSHGGSYMAEGAFFIRIGLPPRVVPGDFLNLSPYRLI